MGRDDAVLAAWYVGEIGGEALFSELARRATPESAHKWRALAAVEVAVASRLARVLSSRQLPLPPTDAVDELARRRCNAVDGKSWLETMQWLHSIADAALGEMRAAAAELPAQLAPVGELVVRHEIALLRFAEFELAGNGHRSLQPIEAFLGAPA